MSCSRHKKLEVMEKVVRNYFLVFLIKKTSSLLKKFSVDLKLKVGSTFQILHLEMLAFTAAGF